MKLEDIIIGFDTGEFPVAECNIPNALEPEVSDSKTLYLCVHVDVRWPSAFRLEVMTPYTVVNTFGDPSLCYGWTQADFDSYVVHKERPIHEDTDCVIAWRRLSPDDKPEFIAKPVPNEYQKLKDALKSEYRRNLFEELKREFGGGS